MSEDRAALDKRMLDTLPKPPAALWNLPLPRVIAWLHAVADVGGIPGLTWAFDSRNFPGTPAQRSQLFATVAKLKAEAEEVAKFKEKMSEKQQQEEARRREVKERKKAGWARFADA